MGLRSAWKFEYTCGEVGLAAQKRREHHEQRVKWWEDQKNKAEKDLRDNGVEVREYEQTKAYSNRNYADMQVVVDPERQRRYSECCSKVNEHLRSANVYLSFERSLLANKERSIKLHVDDVEFFHMYDEDKEPEA